MKSMRKQIMELHEYMLVTRAQILAERTIRKLGRKPDQIKPSDQILKLFISANGCEHLNSRPASPGRRTAVSFHSVNGEACGSMALSSARLVGK
jgi:hypothetical protein